jgi:hypothetical protein
LTPKSLTNAYTFEKNQFWNKPFPSLNVIPSKIENPLSKIPPVPAVNFNVGSSDSEESKGGSNSEDDNDDGFETISDSQASSSPKHNKKKKK